VLVRQQKLKATYIQTVKNSLDWFF
jgi:hypothetical protein